MFLGQSKCFSSFCCSAILHRATNSILIEFLRIISFRMTKWCYGRVHWSSLWITRWSTVILIKFNYHAVNFGIFNNTVMIYNNFMIKSLMTRTLFFIQFNWCFGRKKTFFVFIFIKYFYDNLILNWWQNNFCVETPLVV